MRTVWYSTAIRYTKRLRWVDYQVRVIAEAGETIPDRLKNQYHRMAGYITRNGSKELWEKIKRLSNSK